MPINKAHVQGSAADQMGRYRAEEPAQSPARPLDWRRKMSDSIAYALLVYTALQIFVTVGALRSGSVSLLPYLALIILIAAIVPACRRLERRWNRLSNDAAADPRFAAAFRRDSIGLWLLAIGLPFALAGLFELLRMMIAR